MTTLPLLIERSPPDQVLWAEHGLGTNSACRLQEVLPEVGVQRPGSCKTIRA